MKSSLERVVITGLGVVSPNGVGIEKFLHAIQNQESGISFHSVLKDLNFSCQIAGTPNLSGVSLDAYFTKIEQRGLLSTGLIYGVIAGLEATNDAELSLATLDQNLGIIFGTGSLGIEKFRESIQLIDQKNVRRLGSTSVLQTMSSGIAAFLSGKLKAGNLVTSNSSACATGTEALLQGFRHIQQGYSKRMLVGSASDSGPYIWGGFDALRILPNQYNTNAWEASRPMDVNSCGFVPSSGAGALVLESLSSAKARKVPIYAEILGGFQNSGGQQNGGSMTAPNPNAVVNCIQNAILNSTIKATEIDVINGHLTATKMDALEIVNWKKALGLSNLEFPYIQSLKGMIGHALAASGSIELVASVLQLRHQFIFGNTNLTCIQPEILSIINESKIPKKTMHQKNISTLIKASFGFGDVNACVVLNNFEE